MSFVLLLISDKMACSQHYQCLLNDVIIDKSFLCDDFIDCTKGDDERFCDFRYEKDQFADYFGIILTLFGVCVSCRLLVIYR